MIRRNQAFYVVLLLALAVAFPACGGGGGRVGAGQGDIDGDGILDFEDNDLDGDGRLNQFDNDIDGDGILNESDMDADGDGILNEDDETPFGPWIPAPSTMFVSSGVATISFGDVPEGQLGGPATVFVQNDTPQNVRIDDIRLAGSGGGVYHIDTAGAIGRSLSAGQTAQFTVTFTPKSGTPALGRIEVQLRISGQTYIGIVHLLGMGSAPALTASGAPTTINFGDVPVGNIGGPGLATLSNDTSIAYEVTRIELTGTGGGTFTLDLSRLPGGAVPFSLNPGDTVHFMVAYAPLTGVPNIGEVLVDLDDGLTVKTLGLDLLGQGIAPNFTLDPAIVADFGTRIAGVESHDIAVQVGNAAFANGDLDVTSIDLVDDAGGQFALVANPAPFSVAPGGPTVPFTVRFQPGAASDGEVTGRVVVRGNDPLVANLEYHLDLVGIAARWQASTPPLGTDYTGATGANALDPVWLSGGKYAVIRSAGPNGVFGGLNTDDHMAVVEVDPNGDGDFDDARVPVRWTGISLSPGPAGAPVDAGNGRHIFFLSGGVDGAFGTADDQINVLDIVSGTRRSALCPNVGERKSLPQLIDKNSGRVVVAAGNGGGVVPSADVLHVYENLLGNLNLTAPSSTVGLGAAVPDFEACTPVALNGTTVVMPCADGADEPDLSDRSLEDGNEGLVQVWGIGTSAEVERLELFRPLARVGQTDPGDLACRPVVTGAGSVLVTVMGSGDQPTPRGHVRVDGLGAEGASVAATLNRNDLDGLAARPVPVGDGTWMFSTPGADANWGTSDDLLVRLTATGSMSSTDIDVNSGLVGEGGAASVPAIYDRRAFVSVVGVDGIVGTGDDRIFHISPSTGMQLGFLPVTGGIIAGDRQTTGALGAPRVLDRGFLLIAERGVDGTAPSADDQIRVFWDRNGNGRFDDDLNQDGPVDDSDAAVVLLPFIDSNHTPFGAGDGPAIVNMTGGLTGTIGGGDDQLQLVWLSQAHTLDD